MICRTVVCGHRDRARPADLAALADTQFLEGPRACRGVTALVLSPHGHIEHVLYGVDVRRDLLGDTEPGAARHS